MKVLLGYTTCLHTREAFEAKGHDVWSCDLISPLGHNHKHYQCDIWEIANDN